MAFLVMRIAGPLRTGEVAQAFLPAASRFVSTLSALAKNCPAPRTR